LELPFGFAHLEASAGLMGEAASWQRRAEGFVLHQIDDPPGCWRWAGEERLHGSGQMLEEIGRRFIERYFSWWPYLYPDLDDTSEAEEVATIEAGEINATSFCYVGAVASKRSALTC
jgi:hypothetical protein